MSNDVSVKVSADSSQFAAGLARVEQSLESFKHHANEQFTEMGKELLGAFALTAVVEGIKGLFEEFSKVADLSSKLGISAEAVQRLGAVAKASGLETGELAKLISKVGVNAYEASQGNAELGDAFKTLGINTAEFVNLSPTDQIKALSEAMEKSGRSAETDAAMKKALGKSYLDLIPVISKTTDEIDAQLDSVHVASNETVANMKEVTEKFEVLWANFKGYAADAISFVTKRVEALGTGFAAIGNYLANLRHGLTAAKQAFSDTLDAAAELQVEEDKRREDAAKTKKPVDAEDNARKKEQLKEEEEAAKELAKLKEQNAKKEEEAHFRNLELLEKQKELEEQIAALKNKTPANDLEAEQNKGKILDYQKELESVNKDIARDKERDEKKLQDELAKAEKEKAKEELRDKKEALKEAQKSASELEKAQKHSFSVDSLRAIGGGLSNVNYNANAAKQDMERQQLDYARQQVDKLQMIVDSLEKQGQQVPSYDGSFN